VRVAIVGSRDYAHLGAVIRYVWALPGDAVVVSGGARGVDRVAAQTARARGLETEVYPADWTQGRGAGLARNSAIVRRCDRLVAFWDGTSRGTADAIRKARLAGKPVEVITEEVTA